MITPKSKIQEIIDKYPELEEKIFHYAPSFKALSNSTLRNTVAKVTTLQQMATSSNLNVSEVVNELRRAAGIEEQLADSYGQAANSAQQPEWLNPDRKITLLDVREMLERGEHPVNQVMAELTALPNEEVYQIIAPFLPVPLIEKAAGIGFTHWSDKINDQLFEIYFFKQK